MLAPNHYTEFDPLVVGLVVWKLGRAPRFLAKACLFKVPVLGWLLRDVGPDPGRRARGSKRHADARGGRGRSSSKGRMVVVYPEGTLTREPDLWPMRGKTGAVRLALERRHPAHPDGALGRAGAPAALRQEAQPLPAQDHRRDRRRPVDLSRVPRQAARPGVAR